MQRYPFEEYTKAIWVALADNIANTSAPTVAELTAGTDITCFLTKDGLRLGVSTNAVDGGGLCNRADIQSAGSVGFSPMLKGYRDNEAGGDTLWNLAEWSDAGFLVIRRGVLYATAIAATQVVEVYPMQFGQKSPGDSASNTNQFFEVPLFLRSQEWDLDAVVAA